MDISLKRFVSQSLIASMWANLLFAAPPRVAPATPSVAPPSVAAPRAPSMAGEVAGPAQKPRVVAATQSAARTPRIMAVDPFTPKAGEAVLFGPEKFIRTTGPKDQYTRTFSGATWIVAPFRLHIENGEPVGTNRVSSATVSLNGTQLITQSDLNQQIAGFDKPITVTKTNQLVVTLASAPTSFLRIGVFGTSADHSAPQISISQPASAATINDVTPNISIRYSDPVGAGEPAASGVDTDSLVVKIDNVDRTPLFTKRSDEASGTLPLDLALAEGPHEVRASIADVAGNRREVTSTFRVDLHLPQIAIVSPASGSYLPTLTPSIRVTFSDDIGIDPATLAILVNGIDRTASFVRTPADATWTANSLTEGVNQITATIRDLGGNVATASSSFNVDLKAPQVTIASPAADAVFGSASVGYSIRYTDDQLLDLGTFHLTIDGTPVEVTAAADGVSGTTTPLADGVHTLVATMTDRAGNVGTSSRQFHIDTDLPRIVVVTPLGGANVNNPTPKIRVEFSDTQGIEPGSLHVRVNGVDQTSSFAPVAEGAVEASIPLQDGSVVIAAEVKDTAGNTGSTTSTFLVDTLKPSLAIVAPVQPTNAATPATRITYADGGSGIDAQSVTASVDGADITSLFVFGPDAAAATLPVLTDGSHELRASIADRAGNRTDVTQSFLVDTKAPLATITMPADNSFVGTATPAIHIDFADTAGSGIDRTSVRLFLQRGDGAETEITSAATIRNDGLDAAIAPDAILRDGTNRVRVVVRDVAGNATEATSSFEVDTIAPTWRLETPTEGSFVATGMLMLVIAFDDERSGVDASRIAISVDGVDRTAAFAIDAAQAVLPPPQAEGRHTVEVTLFDRAGNRTPARTEGFTVDTIHPTVTVVSPIYGAYLAHNLPAIAFAFDDANGSGIAGTQITIDGVDRTSEFTTTPAGAQSQLTTALADGNHTVTATVNDWAGNSGTAATTFAVDTINPTVAITTPSAGQYTNQPTIHVEGTVADASPVAVVVSGVNAVVNRGTFSADVPVTGEGTIEIVAVATDAAGNHAETRTQIRSDRALPVVTIASPAANAIVRGPSVSVSGSVSDASPFTVDVNEAAAVVEGNNFTANATAADGPFTITARARDAANNVGTATTNVTVDSTAPVITITAPADGAAFNTTTVHITGRIEDLTNVTLRVGGTSVPVTGGAFEYDASLTSEGESSVTFDAVDAAGNTSSKTLKLVYDKTAPSLQVATPDESAVIAALPVVLRGTATDATALTITVNGTPATITNDGWEASLTSLTEGPQRFEVIATDAAGNTTKATRSIVLDLSAPVLTITAPVSGAFTNQSSITITGSATDVSLKSVTAAGVTGTIAAPDTGFVNNFTIASVPVAEGDNSVHVVATDGAGRTAEGTVVVTRDSTPPVVTVSVPEQIALNTTATATAVASDAIGLVSVRITLNGAELIKVAEGPYVTTFAPPAEAKAGDILTLVAEATDKAGNVSRDTKTVTVVAAGVVVGQVLADETGLPIEGATVSLIGKAKTTTTDARGKYSLASNDSSVVLAMLMPDGSTTTVERQIAVASSVGTVPVDARLTRIAPPVVIGPAGGTVGATNISVAIPAGALTSSAQLSLTPLSSQGLPNLLPLGWSPVAAFDLRGASALASPAAVTFASVTSPLVHLVSYDTTLHAWTMVAPSLHGPSITAPIAHPGAFALVVVDNLTPPLQVPSAGDVLPGAPMVALPSDVVSKGDVTPPTLPPTGGDARGSIALVTTTPLPSGTVVQASVSETYALASGDTASTEERTQDIVTYRVPAVEGAALSAQVPIKPSRSFENGDLLSGQVHLDILAGRETVRGKSGGTQAVSVSSDIATLIVAAGSTTEDTAVSIKSVQLSAAATATTAAQPIAELVVDLGGKTLVGSSRVDLQACKLEYSIVSPK